MEKEDQPAGKESAEEKGKSRIAGGQRGWKGKGEKGGKSRFLHLRAEVNTKVSAASAGEED